MNMKTLKIKGIVISESNMGDFDKMVTVLTPTGKIGCAAKGARRPKSLLMAGTQYLCFSDFPAEFFSGAYTLTLVSVLISSSFSSSTSTSSSTV